VSVRKQQVRRLKLISAKSNRNNDDAEWRGKPVWIINRTDEMIAELSKHNDQLSDPDSEVASQQPAYSKNASRQSSQTLL